MMGWIVVYSLFFSSDFIDEAQILFGSDLLLSDCCSMCALPPFKLDFALTMFHSFSVLLQVRNSSICTTRQGDCSRDVGQGRSERPTGNHPSEWQESRVSPGRCRSCAYVQSRSQCLRHLASSSKAWLRTRARRFSVCKLAFTIP